MDMSGKFERADDDGKEVPTVAIGWRDGEPIPIDLARQPAPRPRRYWPEHVAIAALFIATWALAANQLGI